MNSLEKLRQIREKAQQEMNLRSPEQRVKITVSMGTSGIAMGAREVQKAFLQAIQEKGLTDVLITQTGEKGISSMEPVVDVAIKDKPVVTYGNMTPEKVKKVIEEHVVGGKEVVEFIAATE